MLGIWRRVSAAACRRRALRANLETMEGRMLLSAVAPPAAPTTSRPTRAEVIEARHEHREEVHEQRIEKLQAARQKRLAAYNAQYNTALNAAPTVGQGVTFAYHTLATAHKLIHSPNLQNVAVNFAKLSVSHDTRKVAAAYLDAFVHGDFSRFAPLANTKLVTNIGKEYTDLSHSSDVKKVSRAFTHFGDAVATQIDHLFTLGSGS